MKIRNLILDGAPLVPAGGFLTRTMVNFYANIVKKSRQRDPKTLQNCTKVFLPAKYLEHFLKVADNMSDASAVSVPRSICNNTFPEGLSADAMHILYLHGTKSNEMLSKKSAKLMKKHYPTAEILRCKGMGHAELLCFHPQEWIRIIDQFLSK